MEHRGARHGRELPAGGRDSWADGQIAEIEPHDEPEHASEDPRALALMREHVATLPELERAFHEIRHTQGLSQREVMKRLALTHWNVRTLDERLREQLLALMKRAGLIGDPSNG